jgi:hypothetical protein
LLIGLQEAEEAALREEEEEEEEEEEDDEEEEEEMGPLTPHKPGPARPHTEKQECDLKARAGFTKKFLVKY